MAAPQQTERPVQQEPVAAHVVGNSFVTQFYNVLHMSPELVQHFYTEKSKLTRAEAGVGGFVVTAETQQEIHNKIMSTDYKGSKADIETVISQHSLGGGVMVMVTGCLHPKDGGRRRFAQSFFLAPQEKGYYVLNDIFRYLDEKSQVISAPHPGHVANGIPGALEEPEDTLVIEVEESLGKEISLDRAELVNDVEETVNEAQTEVVEQAVASSAPVQYVECPLGAEEAGTVVEAPATVPLQVEEPRQEGKKSYASILRVANATSASPSMLSPASVPEKLMRGPAAAVAAAGGVEAAASPTPAAAAAAATAAVPSTRATPPQETPDEPALELTEQDARSVFVKNLPLSISQEEVTAAFEHLGTVKFANVKNQKPGTGSGSCYAFVEFADPATALKAIESSPVMVQGRPAHVEEKRPLASRSGNRNRGGLGGGRNSDRPMYRGDGRGRGGGPYSGRGGRSGAMGGEREGGSRGRGGVGAGMGGGSGGSRGGAGGGAGSDGVTPAVSAAMGGGGEGPRPAGGAAAGGASERRPGSGDGSQGERSGGNSRQGRSRGGGAARAAGGGGPSHSSASAAAAVAGPRTSSAAASVVAAAPA